MSLSEEKIFVFDADVIIHFMQAQKLADLQHIYPKNQKVILEKVLAELTVFSRSRAMIHTAIEEWRLFSVVPFPISTEMMKEYAHLTSPLMDMGKGESACMSYCKFTENIVVSSNLRDVGTYCKRHNIDLITTLDLVKWAFENGLWSEDESDAFIATVKRQGGRLPVSKIREY